MIIGERIRRRRIELGYTQQDVGDLLGVTKVSVCGYEMGTRTPTMGIFLKLIDILDVPVDYLLGNDMPALKENGEEYGVMIAPEDLAMIEEIKTNRELYNKFCSDPKRTVQLIVRKLK